MKLALSRGALVLNGDGHERERVRVLPLTSPVNDLIGLRADADYVVHLTRDYHWPSSWPDDFPRTVVDADSGEPFADPADAESFYWREGLQEQTQRWKTSRLPRLFQHAAQAASEGRYLARLGPHFERVQRHPAPEPDQVADGDLPALAAWAVNEALRLRPLKLVTCPLCKQDWLTATEQQNPYCHRPPLGHQAACRDLIRDQQFKQNRGDWRREYKRLHERHARGTLSQKAWDQWRQENTADAWFPYETWREHKPWLTAQHH